LISNQEVRCDKHYNESGSAGLNIGSGSTGAINLTGTKYQGHNNSIVTLNGSGQIQQPSDNATIDGNGNATFKNIELLNIASSGEIKAKIIQSNDNANTLSLLNRSTIAGKGIVIDATTNGNVQLTGDSYINDPNRLIRLNTDGTIEKTPLICDGASNNNLSGVNTLSTISLVSGNILNSGNVVSPNFTLGTFGGGTGSAGTMNINSGDITNTGNITPITDNTKDIGTTSIKYKDVHIGGDIFVAGDQFGLASKIQDGQTLTTAIQTDLNVQKGRITQNETDIAALQAGGGGGGSISGISSVDNGNGDIEISFSGTDYKQAGYLSIDANGRIQVTPSLIVTNAEYDSINTKWLNQGTDPNRQVQKIYLPNGVPIGGFDHTIHKALLVGIAPIFGTRFWQETRFIGYIENGTPRTTIGTVDLNSQNIFNAYEIYTTASQGHPNNVVPSNEKQHIINHFLSDYNHNHYNSFQAVNVVRIAVLSGDVGNWDHTKPFFAAFDISPFVSPQQSGIITLYGSQNGFTVSNASASYGTVPSGYTEIF